MSPDPSTHRQREQQMMQHVEKLLTDDRLRIDTTQGRRPLTGFIRDITRTDRGSDLKRLMSEMNLPDRELQNRMPIGESVEVTLSRQKWFFFKTPVGRLRVVCVSPTRELLSGREPKPMGPGDVSKLLSSLPPSLGKVPSTVVLVSTSGFTLEAHEMAERRAERTVVLVEPNGAGGWTPTGPVETKALADLFDPEAEDEKRERVREHIQSAKLELATGGLAADRIAAKMLLPPQLVEAELKTYAKSNPGLVAKRLDGRVVLFREGTAPPSAQHDSGGASMPLIERMKALFARKGETEKKISFLSERRATLSLQRDRSYEEMGALEQQEAALRLHFKEAPGSITKRRITSQLLQLRKDIERRQQLLGMLNQQINVVSTHLHNLELVQQGQSAKLPDAEEITEDAVKAEEMLAQLEADSELVGSVAQTGASGMSEEEQALFEELERESSPPAASPAPPAASAGAAPPAADAAERARPAAGARSPERNGPEPG